MTPDTKRPARARTPLTGLLWTILMQPLWAVPFGLFFHLLYGDRIGGLVHIYLMSLVFSISIGLAIWVVRWFVDPGMRCSGDDDLSIGLRVGGAYTVAAVVGSYAAAIILNFTLEKGFLGSWRAVLISGVFTLLFSAIFVGVNFSIVFYRHAVNRARAVEQARAELAQAELRALRAQINPHFLFNTLNTIAALIRQDPDGAEDTTTRLADLFRYTLRGSEREHVSLSDELGFLRDYLAIEQRRFGDRLRIVESIAPGLEQVPVPSLLLQPVVENAVRHGAGARPEGGTVWLSAERQGDTLVFEVRDDGPGMRTTVQPGGSGFGLHSVRERLRVAGPPHAIEIHSEPDQGTRIRITLPIALAPSATARPSSTGDRS